MKTAAWLRRRALLAYFALAYGLSWGGILMILAANSFDLTDLRPVDTGLMFVAMLLGPSVAGLALTALLEGRSGMHELGARLVRWRFGGRWYAVALLTMPISLLAVLWSLGIAVDAVFAPRFQWPLFAIGLAAGCCEEIGWTGYATPRLLARLGQYMAGLSLGLVWAIWHLLVDFRQNFSEPSLTWLTEFAVLYGATLTAYRLLMTWVYANTKSLLLAMLMHASYTGWLLVLFPATSFRQGLAWQSVFATVLWVVVIVVMAAFPRGAPMLPVQPVRSISH